MRLIDADALLNDSSIVYHTEFGDAVVDVEDIKKAPTIKTFTLADIEEQYRKGLEKGLEEARPHGEWTYHKYDKDYECSSCGVRFDEEEITVEIPQENHNWVRVCRFAFCPMCGSDNRKEGEANV